MIDLRSMDFSEASPVNLRGEWEFSWQEFVPAGAPMPDDNTSLIKLPLYWNSHVHNGTELDGEGWATYRLRVLLPDNPGLLGFNLKFIHSAYRLYADEELIASAGTADSEKEGSKPVFRQDNVFFKPSGSELTVTMHVSNYHHSEGGFWEDVRLGSAASIMDTARRRNAIDVLLISCIMVMGLYHIGIHFIRKDDKAALYFGLFNFLISLRALTTGEIIITKIFPDIPWVLMLKIEYLGFYAALPVFMMYLYELFPEDCSLVIKRFFQTAGLVFILQVLMLPPLYYNKTLLIYQLITGAGGIYTIVILSMALYRKRRSSLILLTGFLFLFASFVNDVLHANEVIHTGLILPAGLVIFTLSQAILILNRSAQDHALIKVQHDELMLSNDLLKRSRQGTILGLAKLAEYRDEDTGRHLERIREYCRLLAGKLAEKDEYRDYITDRYIEDLYQSSILHDIGKVGVPDAVLLKNGKLDEDEFASIKQHTLIGGDAIQNIEYQTDMKSFLTLGKEIAWYHHEKWNGSGYPRGLAGEDIPLSARITAVADVYDALTSERPYKKAFSHEKACEIIRDGRGSHFDPVIVDLFFELETEILEIRDKLMEDEA